MDNKEIRFNSLFWIIYFVYQWLVYASVGDEYYRYLISAFVLVPITFLAAFFTIHVFFKNYFLSGQKKRFWIFFLMSVVVFTLARRSFVYFYIYPNYMPHALLEIPYLYWPKLLIEGVNIYLIVGLNAMFYFVKELYKQQRISFELKQDKVETELQLLKSQVHPHFIFNSLNNIYSLAERGHPKTKDLIFRLSAFLSYSLYEGVKDIIPLNKELDYIKHYIELEKIRYDGELDISINVYTPLDEFIISPLLLLPLVENAFKHGLGDSKANSWIRLDFISHGDWLTFKIENSIHDYDSIHLSDHGGIGIMNLKKRLDILYPKNHSFQLFEEESSFLAILKVKKL